MALFSYTARQLNGQIAQGEATAASRSGLAAQLASEGLVLIEARSLSGRRSPRAGLVKLPALLAFLRDFATLSRSGMPLTEVLRHLERRPDAPALSAAIVAARKEVQQGLPLDEALGRQSRVFPPIVTSAIRAGVSSGRLDAALGHLVSHLEMSHALERKIRKAMTYPLFLMAMLAVVLATLMLFVLPRFAGLYAEFDTALPWPTQVLMTLAEAAPLGIPILLAAVLALLVLYRTWVARPLARRLVDRAILRLPMVGAVAMDRARVQVSVVLGLLMASGTALRPALLTASEACTNTEVRARLLAVREAISAGTPLPHALDQAGIFSGVSLSLISAGDAAGDLETSFAAVAEHHRAQVQDRLDRLLSLIEPAMMLIVGLVLGGVVIAVYLPIFGLSGVVQ